MFRPDRMTLPRTRHIASWQTRLISATLGFCALGSLAACTERPQEEPVIAMINGRSITQSEFDIRWEDLSQATRTRYEKDGGKRRFLDELIMRELLMRKRASRGWISPMRFAKRPCATANS